MKSPLALLHCIHDHNGIKYCMRSLLFFYQSDDVITYSLPLVRGHILAVGGAFISPTGDSTSVVNNMQSVGRSYKCGAFFIFPKGYCVERVLAELAF